VPTSRATAWNSSLEGTSRDERRHAPQRGLLVGEPLDLLARLPVGDRRRDELGEVRQAALGIGGQGIGLGGGHDHGSPETARDDDGDTDGGTDSDATGRLGDHSLQAGVVVDASRPTGLQDLGHHVGALEGPAGSDAEDGSLR
jgi:hypothetical protein